MAKKKVVETQDLETLEQIKERLLKKGQEEGHLDQKEIFEATNHLELSDIDIENLLEYFADNNVDINDNAEDNIDDIDETKLNDDSSIIDSDLFEDDGYVKEKIDDDIDDIDKYAS